MRVILASQSPRRRELLQQIGWELEVRTAPCTEAKTAAEVEQALSHQAKLNQKATQSHQATLRLILQPFREKDGSCGPDITAAYNAYSKGWAVREHLAALAVAAGIPPEAAAQGTTVPIVAADTLVTEGGLILGKPKDKAEALEMLLALSGKWHEVKTGVAIFYRQDYRLRVVTTRVLFRRLSRERLAAYAATGEPLDKAGAYGIQGRGALLVEKIAGSYDNVVGLPLTVVDQMIEELLTVDKEQVSK